MEFFKRLNSISLAITFTMEKETDNYFPLLDILVENHIPIF